VVLIKYRTKLYAWELLDGNFNMTRLPSAAFSHISALGDRVAVTTTSNECLIWTVKKGMRKFDFIPPDGEHQLYMDTSALFHPHSANTIFIIIVRIEEGPPEDPENETLRWVVEKYVDNVRQEADRASLAYPLVGTEEEIPYRPELENNPEDYFRLDVRKCDDNGTYSIALVPTGFSNDLADIGCSHQWDHASRPGYRHLAHYITYNVYDGSLLSRYFHLPVNSKDIADTSFMTTEVSDAPVFEASHMWSAQIFSPIQEIINPTATVTKERRRLPNHAALLFSTKSCDEISGTPADVEYISGYGPNHSIWTIPATYSNHDLGLMYCLVGDTSLPSVCYVSPVPRGPDLVDRGGRAPKIKVRGDGNFIVLFGAHDFVVWRFNARPDTR
jgi:hypothetical protein